jgi:hypothetical protein
LCRSTRTASSGATKHIPESKQIAQYVLDATEPRRAPISPGSAGNTGVSESVVTATLITVRKNGVSLGRFFELLFSFRVTLIFVRMILMREFAVRALQFLFGRTAPDT